MANGFVQRWMGKVAGKQFWQATPMGAAALSGPLASIALTTGSTMALPYTNFSLTATTGIAVFGMNFAPAQGLEVVIQIASVSSAIQVKAAPGASFDPSTNTVFKSTYQSQITLVGLSTTKWGIKSIFPSASTLIGGSGLTLSTTT